MTRAPATPVKKKGRYHKKGKKGRSLGHLLRRMLRRWRAAYGKRVIARAANAPLPCPAQGKQPSSQEEGTEYKDSHKFAWPKSDDSGTPTPTLYENRCARYGQQTVRGSDRKQAQSALHAKALCSREMSAAQVTPAPVARQRSSLWHYTDPGIIRIPYHSWIPVVTLPRLVFPIMHPQSADRPLLNSSQPNWVDLVKQKAEPLFSQSRALQAPDAWRFKPLAIAWLPKPARAQQSPQPGSNGDYECPLVKESREKWKDQLVAKQPTTNSGCMRSNSKKRHYPGERSAQPASKRLRPTPSTSEPWPLKAPETSILSASAILPGKQRRSRRQGKAFSRLKGRKGDKTGENSSTSPKGFCCSPELTLLLPMELPFSGPPSTSQQLPQPGSRDGYEHPSVKNLTITRQWYKAVYCQGDLLVVEQPTTNSGFMRSDSRKRHYTGEYLEYWDYIESERLKDSVACALTQFLQSKQRKRQRTGEALVEEPKIKIQRLIAGVAAFPGAPGLQNMQAAQPVQDILQQPIPRQQ